MLKEVLRLKGLNLDEVATFGDGLNDVCMLKGFPYSFTPANGCKEAKEAATYTLTKTGGNGAIQEGLHTISRFQSIPRISHKKYPAYPARLLLSVLPTSPYSRYTVRYGLP